MQITDKTPRPNYKLEIDLTAEELDLLAKDLGEAVYCLEAKRHDRFRLTLPPSERPSTPLLKLMTALQQFRKEMP